jgi:hypothetical protein
MPRPSEPRLAQIAIGALLLVIIRSLSEFFRLRYLHGQALDIGKLAPYVAGALFAAVALAFTVICYFTGRYRASMAITVGTIILLFVYKVAAAG